MENAKSASSARLFRLVVGDEGRGGLFSGPRRRHRMYAWRCASSADEPIGRQACLLALFTGTRPDSVTILFAIVVAAAAVS